jgi:hypothetical protein
MRCVKKEEHWGTGIIAGKVLFSIQFDWPVQDRLQKSTIKMRG